MKKYKYFLFSCYGQDNNLEGLNKLLEDGWIPERESTPSSPSGSTYTLQGKKFSPAERFSLILLYKFELDDFGEPK